MASEERPGQESLRTAIVREARVCLGTPFRHQGRRVGRGLDCVGLVAHVGRRLGLVNYDHLAYGRVPPKGALEQHLAAAGLRKTPIDAAHLGDLYLIAFDRSPQHLAIKTDLGIIHAYLAVRRVVEHRLDAAWRARVVAAYAFPGL